MNRHPFGVLVVLFVFVLNACESSQTKSSGGLKNIIPTAERDRGPDKHRDMSHVPEPAPKYEKRTIAGNKSPYMVKGVIYHVQQDPIGYREQGLASWYGEKFHGNSTSNGEVYDMYGMTAAHKTLPIPSYVKVVRTDTGKSIVVRVNDRGPFAAGRVIDLSYTAAQRLGFLDRGTAPVEVSYIHVAKAPDRDEQQHVRGEEPQSGSAVSKNSEQVYLQLGAYRQRPSAETALAKVEGLMEWPVSISEQLSDGVDAMFRVQVGPLPDEITVEILRQALVREGFSETHRVFK